MKQVAAFAFNRPTAAWLLVTDHEWRQLGGLEAWVTRLFLVLLACSDFRTGHGRTGYGELITSLTPDQPERGPRLWAPSRDDVKASIRKLEALLLVAVDKTASDRRKAIFFHVPPRTRASMPARKLPPELAPSVSQEKRAKLPPSTPPLVSEKNSYPLPLVDNKLSTAARQGLQDLKALRVKLAGHAARG